MAYISRQMSFWRCLVIFAVCLLITLVLLGSSNKIAKAHVPGYTDDGRLYPQPDYRDWIYLSSGFDMSYTPRAAHAAGQSTFDNVFVNPEAYESFKQTGTWPDGTMLVLEVRRAENSASINKSGYSQGHNVLGVELHVKDTARGGWAFYGFDGATPAKMLPKNADCYSCHRDHGAVDTTFVQFYPTLIPTAQQKHTFSMR
jgi:hypothetical protein